MKKEDNFFVKNHRGQMKLSFGMIFSIILIIVFIGFAFYAIKSFLGLQSSAEIEKFINDLQSDINKVWKSSQASQEEEYSLPSEINYVCFVDFFSSKRGDKENIYEELKETFYGGENIVFYPIGSSDFDSTEMDHIDIEETTKDENPFCIENSNGKVGLRILKDFEENLITITR
jgi:uncharacterized protein (UPF0333 family)